MTRAGSLVGLGLIAAAVLTLTAIGMGGSVFAVAAILALLPLPLYVAIVLWLDRFEPEPRGMLATAFLWGASIAVVVAGLANGLVEQAAGPVMTSIVSAPLVEEALKGAILLRFFVKRKDEFDGVVDGVIYAAMVGLGFAFAENIDYYGRAFKASGVEGLGVVFTLRAVIAPFSHPLFTGAFGLGLGLARQLRSRSAATAAAVLGFVGAVGLHLLWNAGASAGLVFFGVYSLVMLPALAVLFVAVALALRFEGRIIRARLAPEAAAGLISTGDYAALCSARGRLHALSAALQGGGVGAWKARRVYHRAASELAFLRHRADIDGAALDPALEERCLRDLGVPPAAGAEGTGSEPAGTEPAGPASG